MQLLLDALELFVVVVVLSDELPASDEASVLDEHSEADADEDDAAEEDETVEFAARSRPPVFCCCSRCSLRVLNAISWWTHSGRCVCVKAYLVVTPVVSASTMLCDWFWLLFCGLRELRVRWRDLRSSCL